MSDIMKVELHGKHGEGKFALVDSKDFEIVNLFKWTVDKRDNILRCKTGVIINDKWTTISMSRLVMNAKPHEFVDHKKHDGLDNRQSKLRVCTLQENNMNSRSRKNTSSKYKGVSWCKSNKKWIATICKKRKRLTIGRFYEEKAAAQAYNFFARELHGEFAYYNDVGRL